MRKASSVVLGAALLALSHSVLADVETASTSETYLSGNSVEQTASANNRTKRMLWEPHLRIFNDTNQMVIIYTANTKMTYYPGDTKDPYYGLKTWGAQNVLMIDKQSGEVFYNARVVDETFLHIRAKSEGGKTVYTVSTEPMPDNNI